MSTPPGPEATPTAEGVGEREMPTCPKCSHYHGTCICVFLDSLREHVICLAKAETTIAAQRKELDRLNGIIKAGQRDDCEIMQLCGKALGYPWFKDDQKNFPGATEEHGISPGDHVPVTIVMELAKAFADQREAIRGLVEMTRAERFSVGETFAPPPRKQWHARRKLTSGFLRQEFDDEMSAFAWAARLSDPAAAAIRAAMAGAHETPGGKVDGE